MRRRNRDAERVRALREQLREQGLLPPEQMARTVSSGLKHRVSEDTPYRRWRPEQKCPDAVMNLVLEIFLEYGTLLQRDLAEMVQAETGAKLGTARAMVSGALLGLRQAGMVRCVEDGCLPVWEVVE